MSNVSVKPDIANKELNVIHVEGDKNYREMRVHRVPWLNDGVYLAIHNFDTGELDSNIIISKADWLEFLAQFADEIKEVLDEH